LFDNEVIMSCGVAIFASRQAIFATTGTN